MTHTVYINPQLGSHRKRNYMLVADVGEEGVRPLTVVRCDAASQRSTDLWVVTLLFWCMTCLLPRRCQSAPRPPVPVCL
jgi:hypothetical protein